MLFRDLRNILLNILFIIIYKYLVRRLYHIIHIRNCNAKREKFHFSISIFLNHNIRNCKHKFKRTCSAESEKLPFVHKYF